VLNGIHLTLMIGPVVPVPAPRSVVEALTAIQVTSSADSPSGFQLTFSLEPTSPLQTLFMLTGISPLPLVRVVITVTVKGIPHVLMDGVMTHHQVSHSDQTGAAVLTVTGEDLTAIMNQQVFSGIPYPAMPPEARVALIIAKYSMFGVVPLVIPCVLTDIPNPLERTPQHRGTDYAYLKYLANYVGYVFYIDPGPAPGMSIGYWGPEIKVGIPQPALSVNMGPSSNVDSMSFSFDNQSKTLPILLIHEQRTGAVIPIPLPDITPLNPPLGAVAPLPNKVEWLTGTARRSPIQAAIIGMAKAARSADCVSATGSLDVLRYGHLLKARQLVGVRGVGMAFDGLYFVKKVTHDIKQGEYKESFTLSRSGLISTLPRVPA
jgi:hypothetical protein